jgi:hypothetical protein
VLAVFESNAILLFDDRLPYRCPVPAAVLACVRTNPKCPRFDLFVAAPRLREDMGFAFLGQSLGDQITRVRKGTIDAKGRFTAPLPNPAAPPLALACAPDRAPTTIAVLTSRVQQAVSALGRGLAPKACAGFESARENSNPVPAQSPAGATR